MTNNEASLSTTVPLPKVGQTITFTQPGYFNRRCDCGGTAIATAPHGGNCVYQPNGDGVACGKPYDVRDWQQSSPQRRTAKVRKVGRSATGAPLVFVAIPGSRDREVVNWQRVTSCEVTA